MPIPDKRRRELESKLAREVSKFNGETRRRLIQLIGDPPSLERITPDVLREIGSNLRAVLSTPLEQTFIESANEMMKETGFNGVSTDLINEGASRWSREYIPRTVDGMINTRLNNATNLVSRYYEGDFDRRGLIERLSRDYSPAKAEQIAITESTRAANEGQRPVIEELESNGVVMRGIWRTVRDRRVCPVCEPLNGLQSETVGFETRFENNGKSYDRPPAHVGCRCLVSFEYVEEEVETPPATPPAVEETVAEGTQPADDPTRYEDPERWQTYDDVKKYYAEKHNIEFVIPDGTNIEGVKVITRAYDQLASDYPMVAENINLFKVYEDEQMNSKTSSSALAFASSDGEIGWRKTYVNDRYNEEQTPEKGGWVVTDHNSIEQTLTHEFGHQLHYWIINNHSNSFFTGYLDSSGFGSVYATVNLFLRSNTTRLQARGLSAYGLTNNYETFAELFVASRYIPNKDKSAIMKRFDKLLELLDIQNYEQWAKYSAQARARRSEFTDEEFNEMVELMKTLGIDYDKL